MSGKCLETDVELLNQYVFVHWIQNYPKLEQEPNFVEILHKSSNFTFSFQYAHKMEKGAENRRVLQRDLFWLIYLGYFETVKPIMKTQ